MKLAEWNPGLTVRMRDKYDRRGRLVERRIGEFTSSEPRRMGFEDSRYSHYYAEVRWQDGRTFACSLHNLVFASK